jgi:hypothetical protein
MQPIIVFQLYDLNMFVEKAFKFKQFNSGIHKLRKII